jgi:NitT/TauT family transport system ATP-binding protein
MSLGDNIALALAKSHPEMEKKWRLNLAGEYLEMVGLAAAARKYPAELSGGMQQRGAIARTLALGSPVLLMDEPFGALDPVNRARLQDLVLDVWSNADPRRTVVFVTHDIEEAIYLADRIVILGSSPGRIIQELRVPFARPRVRQTLTRLPEFQALREQIAERFRLDTLERIAAESVVGGDAEGI